jgi:hypothetical protein
MPNKEVRGYVKSAKRYESSERQPLPQHTHKQCTRDKEYIGSIHEVRPRLKAHVVDEKLTELFMSRILSIQEKDSKNGVHTDEAEERQREEGRVDWCHSCVERSPSAQQGGRVGPRVAIAAIEAQVGHITLSDAQYQTYLHRRGQWLVRLLADGIRVTCAVSFHPFAGFPHGLPSLLAISPIKCASQHSGRESAVKGALLASARMVRLQRC